MWSARYFFHNYKKILTFSTDFNKGLQYKNVNKIRPVAAADETDERTNRNT